MTTPQVLGHSAGQTTTVTPAGTGATSLYYTGRPHGLFCIFGPNSSGGCNGGSVAGGASDFFTNSVPGAFGAAGHFVKRHFKYFGAGAACAIAYGGATGGSAGTAGLTTPEAYALATAACENAIGFAAGS